MQADGFMMRTTFAHWIDERDMEKQSAQIIAHEAQRVCAHNTVAELLFYFIKAHDCIQL